MACVREGAWSRGAAAERENFRMGVPSRICIWRWCSGLYRTMHGRGSTLIPREWGVASRGAGGFVWGSPSVPCITMCHTVFKIYHCALSLSLTTCENPVSGFLGINLPPPQMAATRTQYVLCLHFMCTPEPEL